MALTLTPLKHFPLVSPGDDLSQMVVDSIGENTLSLKDGDILVVAQKVVSKAEKRLFNLTEDPKEQHNRIHDSGSRERYARMDGDLTQAIMDGMQEAFFDRRVYVRDLSQKPWFGREGWVRPYPRKVQDRQ